MIENLPILIPLVFVLTTAATLLLLYYAVTRSTIFHAQSKAMYIVLFNVLWLIIQAILAWNGFYQDTKSLPPKFIFAIGPPLLIIIFLFITYEGKLFIDHMSLVRITYLNTVRIPVELILYGLYLNKAVPELMTFAGRNFDVVAGITAPLVAYLWFNKKVLGKRFMLIWNYVCLALLLNIVVNAVLSAPFPFQKFAFDQPNIAILYFPFIWLPSFIVPVVFFGHLVSIRQLKRLKTT